MSTPTSAVKRPASEAPPVEEPEQEQGPPTLSLKKPSGAAQPAEDESPGLLGYFGWPTGSVGSGFRAASSSQVDDMRLTGSQGTKEEHYIVPATQAAKAQKSALQADIQGEHEQAIQFYRTSAELFGKSAQSCTVSNPDLVTLEEHIASIERRVAYLEEYDREGSTGAKLRPQQHLTRANLKGDVNGYASPSARKTMGAAAAVGGAAGLLALGPFAGVVLAVSAAYATTRDDSVGNVSRSMGTSTVNAVRNVRDANQRFGVTDSVAQTTKSSSKWLATSVLSAVGLGRTVSAPPDSSGGAASPPSS